MSKRTELPHNCRPISFRGPYCEAPTPDNERVRYGSWRDDNDGEWFICDQLSYSDYSGTKPTYESNVRVFADTFKRGEGSWWVWADGGHDTTAIVIRTLAYRNASDVRDVIDGLSDYPILDEDDESDLESEREQEGWDDYGRDDFRRSLVSYIEARFAERMLDCDDSQRTADDIVEAITDDQIDALYYHRCQETNVNGGGTCLWEGESHPHFFSDETIWGRNGASYKGIDDDAWNGLVPTIGADGKVEYTTGEISDWTNALDLNPWCPRCGKVTPVAKGEDMPNVWERPCAEFGCDVPDVSLMLPGIAPSPLGELAAYVLRSWDVGQSKAWRTGGGDYRIGDALKQGATSVGDALECLSKACEEHGDKASAVALRFRDPKQAYSPMPHAKLRRVTRGVLRGLVTGELPKASTIEPAYMNEKPVCCILRGEYCCEHGKSAVECCMLQSSNASAVCPVHGTRENKRKRGEPAKEMSK